MNRLALEHVIRAASAIFQDFDLIIFGSQAVLGSFPNAPEELFVSVEVDVFSRTNPEGADLIDGAMGELSSFHETFGYYAPGVSIEVATLPDLWEQRLVPLKNENTREATGWCIEVHDLAISKLAAGREKDLDYLSVLIRHKMVDQEILLNRLMETKISDAQKNLFRERLLLLFRENKK